MANTKKLIQAAAGAAGGEALNVEDVFSTYLYEGSGSTQTITNGIDLDGEGGMVWIKNRDNTINHNLYDTERGATKFIMSNAADAEQTVSSSLQSFNSDGFTLGGFGNVNGYFGGYASWTFRKAPKFFDVVTYSGSVGSQSIAHNLGSTPGLIITKKLDSSGNWAVYHRSLGATKYILLNSTSDAQTSSTFWNDTEPTSTHFTVGTNDATNNSVRDYVAYLFAHNDGDGEFGPDGDLDAIKCGSVTLSSGYTDVDLGFEPQWILFKKSSASQDWFMYDIMRGITPVDKPAELTANKNNAESSSASNPLFVTPTGFSVNAAYFGSGDYIYIAIRRGPMAVPESATDVFAIDEMDNSPTAPPTLYSGFPVDMAFYRDISTTSNTNIHSRLTGTRQMQTNLTASETSYTYSKFDYMDGWFSYAGALSNYYSWMWRRAPNFFDVVAYTGTGSAQTINHNLGVVPEMVWVKSRNNTTSSWSVTSTELGAGYRMFLTSASGSGASTLYDNGQTPTETVFYRGSEDSQGGTNYIAYLFASLDGVSKVGSYTGNGSSQTIDCGFSSGARFILIKRTDSAGDWYVWDTERGIVAGNDPYLELNTTDAEVTSTDWVDPDNSGFIVNGTTINASSAEYIFYAVA